ncbi:MAG: DUF5723 family protein [Pedobacter sp.]|nr:DUF5723 family protein [Pedobacter sp.]
MLSLLGITQLSAQQYALFGTRTLFDSFENPAIKSFVLDSSSKFASNFLFPNFSVNAANKGDAQDVLRKVVNEGKFTTVGLPIGDGIPNTAFVNTNTYLLTFRLFSHYKYNQEFGFAWQVRSDGILDYTNEGLAVIDTYKRFNNIPYVDVFKTSGYQQSYHQFSFTVRENWDKRLAFGLKFSLLSGMAYNEIHIDHSYINADVAGDRLDIGLTGRYRGSFLEKDEVDRKTFLPLFKNPGASFSFGTTYHSRSGYFIMGNIKDLGFIHWNKDSHIATFNKLKSIVPASTYTSKQINEEITDFIDDVDEQKGFYTPTNAKADFLISRTFEFYKPSLIISKNLFHKGGDVALVNTIQFDRVSASLTPVYNFNNFIMLGLQGMYKTPNFEFFLGSDNISKTLSTVSGIRKEDAAIGSGYLGASFYIGMGIKFGSVVNHPMNFSTMPGVNGQKPYKGFFRSLFGFFGHKSY